MKKNINFFFMNFEFIFLFFFTFLFILLFLFIFFLLYFLKTKHNLKWERGLKGINGHSNKFHICYHKFRH